MSVIRRDGGIKMMRVGMMMMMMMLTVTCTLAPCEASWQGVVATGWNVSPLNNAEIEDSADAQSQLQPQPLGKYPEEELLQHKPSNAVCMSGGGVRAYTATLGSLRALLDLDLLNNTRYLSSVSGSSWANAAFTYLQPSQLGLSEGEFLGEILDPSELTLQVLKQLDMRSGRAAPVKTNLFYLLGHMTLFSHIHPRFIYGEALQKVFLSHAGIPPYSQISWSPNILAKQKAKNHDALNNTTFIFPCEGQDGCQKPFAVLNAAVLGPLLAAPYTTATDNYVPIEFTSLYVGSPQHHDLEYTTKGKKGQTRLVNFTVGGLIETFAFGGAMGAATRNESGALFPPPVFGLGPNSYTSDIHNVPRPTEQFGLSNMTAASSFAPGSFLAGTPLLARLDQTLGLEVPYWSPVTRHPKDVIFSQEAYIADAASLENNGFIAMLRREMKEIVVFLQTPTPLQPRTRYNPFKRPPSSLDIDPAFSSYFGIDHTKPSPIENFSHNQVFPRYELPRIVDAMQNAQALGRGIVVRSKLRTVENSFWGVRAGIEVTVTWVYLGRALEWERQLPKATRKMIQPYFWPEDPSRVSLFGRFAFFPHFPTVQLHYTAEQANLLANLAGWVVRQNAALFKKALGNGAAVIRPEFAEMQ